MPRSGAEEKGHGEWVFGYDGLMFSCLLSFSSAPLRGISEYLENIFFYLFKALLIAENLPPRKRGES